MISRDGSLGFQYREEGGPRVEGATHDTNYVLFRDDPHGIGHVVIVRMPFDLPQLATADRFRLPNAEDDIVNILVECALGELVDEVGDVIEKRHSQVVICDLDLLTQLSKRDRVTEPVARQYLKAKTWWAWKLKNGVAMFYHADRLRLGTPISALLRLAEEHEHQFWDYPGEPDEGGFMLRATRALRKDDPRLRQPSMLGHLIDVRSMLKAPRYDAAAGHLARTFDAANDEDALEAAREAIHALEALAKLVAGTPSGTFADAVKALVRQERLHARLGDALEKVWAFANQQPGLRHGGASAPVIEGYEATFAINVAASAMLHLLELDSLPPA
jgi:hypothetical protein